MDDVVSVRTPAQLADELAVTMRDFWEGVAAYEPYEWETAEILPGWTPKRVVAHVAFWDDFQRRRIEAALAGTWSDGLSYSAADKDHQSAMDPSRTWEEVVAVAEAARAQLVAVARGLDPEVLAATFPAGNQSLSIVDQLQQIVHHTREHVADLHAYCGSMIRWSREALRSMMEQQHTNLLDACAGLNESTMLATRVCGAWPIRDVLAHVASWNEYCSVLLADWPEPDSATVRPWLWPPDESMDAVNDRLLAAWCGKTIIEIYDALSTYHRRMMTAFDGFSGTDLSSEGETWGGSGVLAGFFYEVYSHEAEHAAQIWAYRAGLTEEEVRLDGGRATA